MCSNEYENIQCPVTDEHRHSQIGMRGPNITRSFYRIVDNWIQKSPSIEGTKCTVLALQNLYLSSSSSQL